MERLYSTDYDETGEEEEEECDWEWEEVSEDGEGAGVELIIALIKLLVCSIQ